MPSVGDAEGGEAEAGCGDARYEAAVTGAGRALVEGSVQNQPVGWFYLLGEVEAGAALHVVEERIVVITGRSCGVGALLRGRQGAEDACGGEARKQGATEQFCGTASRYTVRVGSLCADRIVGRFVMHTQMVS